MNVEIGAEAAQFPEKKYINGIAVAVCMQEDPSFKRHDRNVVACMKLKICTSIHRHRLDTPAVNTFEYFLYCIYAWIRSCAGSSVSLEEV